MNALVTGAAGFVGRHLVPKLQAAGYFVDRVDPNFTMKDVIDIDVKRSFVHAVTFKEFVDTGYDDKQYDLVVHLAANIVNVNSRMHKGSIDMFDDVATDVAMCKWIEKKRPKCFVAMSSCATDNTIDPYGAIKVFLESMCGMLHKQGQNVKILRPFSGYGYDQTDEYPFPSIMKRVMRKDDPVIVWGGLQVRDWIHVDDLTDGIMFSIDSFPSGTPIELGTRIGTDFIMLTRYMIDAYRRRNFCAYSPTISCDKTKATNSVRRIAGLARDAFVGQQFDWSPKISLQDGIAMELDKMTNQQDIR